MRCTLINQSIKSIFVFYSRGYGGHANGVHGFITPWGFLQWADDSKVITKILSDARVQEVCEFTCAKAGGGAAGGGDSGQPNLQMSFPCFLQAIVRCAVERANPRWRRDESGRLTTGVPLQNGSSEPLVTPLVLGSFQAELSWSQNNLPTNSLRCLDLLAAAHWSWDELQ